MKEDATLQWVTTLMPVSLVATLVSDRGSCVASVAFIEPCHSELIPLPQPHPSRTPSRNATTQRQALLQHVEA
eukprot:1694479-Amphidinium_carterae.2